LTSSFACKPPAGTTRQEAGHPSVSVVMPCFNSEPFVEEAVRSALEQSYEDVEIIVVDDGSTDQSFKVLSGLAEEYGTRMTLLHQENKGPYPARNMGLKHARGELVAFLDADDYWDSEFLLKLCSAIGRTGADLAYCGWQNVGIGLHSCSPYIPPKYEAEDVVKLFIKDCPWPIHGVLVRKSIIDAVGGFSERYFSAMDYDIWIRLLAVTKKMVQVPEVLAFYRWHSPNQVSAVRWRQVLDAWKVRRDFVENNPALVSHLKGEELKELIHGFLLHSGYAAYWKREIISAHRLFRQALLTGHWKVTDLRYLLPALLPERVYRALISAADKQKMVAG
jgi:glycosyltransferase involved in cell wall biosynthesis